MLELGELFNLQFMMFVEMGVGFFLRRENIITKEGKDVITDLIIDVILPCNIIASFNISMSREVFISGLQVLIISVCIQLLCSLISTFGYRWLPREKRMIVQYGTVCSNAGFLGNPVAEGLYGSMGLLYASLYLIPQRIVMWSAGVSFFTHSPDRKTLVKKVLTHPCIVGVGIGIVLMVSQVTLPAFLDKSIRSLGSCNTPVTMLFIGTVLAEAGLHGMLSAPLFIFSAIRLLGIPLVVLAGCLLCHIQALPGGLSVILAAMPAGCTTAILAAKYGGDEAFATQCVVFTTVLSMVLLPCWCIVLNILFA